MKIKLFENFNKEEDFREEIDHFITNVVDELNLHKADRRKDQKLFGPNFSESLATGNGLTLPVTLVPLHKSAYNGILQYFPYFTEDGFHINMDFLIKREFYNENKDLVMDSIKEFEDRLQEFLDKPGCNFFSLYNRESEDIYFQAFSYKIYKTDLTFHATSEVGKQ